MFGTHPKFTEEHKRKIGEANKGKIASEETREKLSKVFKGRTAWNKGKKTGIGPNIGKKMSEETKRKMSESRKGKPTWNKGKKMSEEFKQKLSEVHKGKNIGASHHNSKKVIQYDLNMKQIKVWHCIEDIRRELGICSQNISKCCKGKYKTVGGFIWKYF